MAQPNVIYRELESAFKSRVHSYQLLNDGHVNDDSFFADASTEFVTRQKTVLSPHPFIKTYATFVVELEKNVSETGEDGIHAYNRITQRFYIYCETKTISSVDTDLKEWFS